MIVCMSVYRLMVAGALALWGGAGCFQPPPVTPDQHRRGTVMMLPGVEGNAWQLEHVYSGLRRAGIDQAIEIVPWGTPPLSSLRNLSDLPRNLERAQVIATKIKTLRTDYADAPLTLIGYSGGGGLAVLTLAALDESVTVDKTILVAAAISNRYDVRPLLARSKRGIVNLHSKRDGIVGAGTKVFGTIDRKKTLSAGHTGFVDDQNALTACNGLTQIEWTPAWRAYGHGGDHLGYLSRDWAEQVLAPMVVQLDSCREASGQVQREKPGR